MGGSMPVNSLGFLSSPTPIDLDMLDSTPNDQRPSLPTSLSDFALFPTSSSSAPPSPSSLMALDDNLNPFFRRLRRSSLLAGSPITALGEAKTNSPLAASFTPRSRRTHSFDSEKMADDSSSEPPSSTPSLLFTDNPSSSSSGTAETTATPPRPLSSSFSTLNVDPLEPPARLNLRGVSQPAKPARLLDLRTETSSPIESELKSEAQFQRLIASYSYTSFAPSKHLPRTPRAWSDRGRYPEEVGGEEEADQGGESGSEDGEDATAASSVHSVSMTPSGSGEDQAMTMTIDTSVGGGFMMDIDMPSSHSAVNSPTHQQQWRQTPPPTSSAVRPNKRKFDDRYDPYPTAAKRRAVSPSINIIHAHAHAHSHSHSHSHSHPHPHPHSHSHSHSHHSSRSGSISHASPISIPIPRAARSVTSSPVLRPTSSPILRPTPMSTSFPSPVLKSMGMSSPTMRSIARLPPLATLRGGSDGERDRERSRKGVDGAGEAVGSLSLA